MNIIAVQLDIAWEDKRKNFKKVSALLEQTDVKPQSLCVLPELFATGFSMDVARIVDSPELQTRKFLSALARRFEIFVVAGLADSADDGRGKNEAIVFDPRGNEIARYCKLHPFSFAGEDKYYRSGDRIITFECNEFTVCPFICYDLRFPEIFRIAVNKYNANLFIIIANWPAGRREHWITLLRARAIENQSYIVGVNRTGSDINHRYTGDSMIIDPQGKILAEAGADECIIHSEIDIDSLLSWRSKFPVLKDIKADYLQS